MPWFWFLLAGAAGGLIVLWLRRSARAGYEEGEAYAKQVCDYSADERGARHGGTHQPRDTHSTGTLLLYPPGVPYREQQIAVFRKGVLRMSEEEMASLATRIRRRMKQLYGA
jgi:hypothetical protein